MPPDICLFSYIRALKNPLELLLSVNEMSGNVDNHLCLAH